MPQNSKGSSRARVENETGRLSLHPLSLEEALRAAMLTGPPPDMPKRERERKPKATATGVAKPRGRPKRVKAGDDESD